MPDKSKKELNVYPNELFVEVVSLTILLFLSLIFYKHHSVTKPKRFGHVIESIRWGLLLAIGPVIMGRAWEY